MQRWVVENCGPEGFGILPQQVTQVRRDQLHL